MEGANNKMNDNAVFFVMFLITKKKHTIHIAKNDGLALTRCQEKESKKKHRAFQLKSHRGLNW